MSYLDAAKRFHEQNLPLEKARVVPCTISEVESLQLQVGMTMPGAYREFLLWMGKGGGAFWQGCEAFYAALTEINSWARDLTERTSSSLRLPPTAFVFFWDYGQVFYFFYVTGDDNPPVYVYLDPNLEEVIRRTTRKDELSPGESYMAYLFQAAPRTEFVMRSKSFSECIEAELQERVRIWRIAGK